MTPLISAAKARRSTWFSLHIHCLCLYFINKIIS